MRHPKDLNEVYEACKRGDVVKLFGRLVSMPLSELRYEDIAREGVYLSISENTLNMSNWTIEEKCPHEEGSIQWALWHGERGKKLWRNDASAGYKVDGPHITTMRGDAITFHSAFLTGWSLAEDK